MSFIKKLRRRGYLWRLLLVLVFIIVLPFALLQYISLSNSYRELERLNEQNTSAMSLYFSAFWSEKTHEIDLNAAKISVEKNFSINAFKKNSWYVHEATKTLLDYCDMVQGVQEMGLYLYDFDKIITTEFAYTIPQFSDKMFKDQYEASAAFKAMLNDREAEKLRLFSPAAYGMEESSSIYILRTVNLSYGAYTDAVVFYELTADTLTESFFGYYPTAQCGLAVYSGDRLFFSTKDFDSSGDVYITHGTAPWSNLRFAISPIDETLRSEIENYYRTMRIELLVVIVVLILLCSVSLYIMYRPIRRTLETIHTSEDTLDSELKTLERLITDAQERADELLHENLEMESDVRKTRRQLIEAMLQSFLNGIPTSSMEYVFNHAFSQHCFLLFTAVNLTLSPDSSDRITRIMTEKLPLNLYITDAAPDEPAVPSGTVFLFVLENSDYTDSIPEILENELRSLLDSKQILGSSGIVKDADGLRRAYLRSRINAFRRLGTSTSVFGNNTLSHFLQSVQSGAYEEASKTLSELEELLLDERIPYRERLYRGYELVVSYLNLTDTLGIELPDSQVSALRSFRNVKELCKTMDESISLVCDRQLNERKSSSSKLRDELLNYLEEHYTDGNLTLSSVAEHFSVSNYICGRIIRDETGFGFKEYITTSRMELAKRLLRSTDKNIYEIAEDTGFYSSSYFVTRFKELMHMSPSEYRRLSSAEEE
ncbi:MAG: helix-turn-helix domain-containing protein [Clostridiales bacterium]|nr:helix-turn-helix domain-containing protein [Clostridiales bacterium]